MPCRDGGAYDSPEYQRKLDKEKIAFLEASLCAALTAFENMKNYMSNDPFDWIDYEEAGIKKEELTGWWNNHLHEDAARRKKEEKEKEKQDLKVSALSKLTEEERKALGLV
jgi:hypothetical protein